MFVFWNNSGSWSISVEAFFYVMLPAIFPALFRRTAGQIVAIAVAAYLLSVLTAAVALAFRPRPDHLLQIFYAMPIFRFPEFVLGICIYAMPIFRFPEFVLGICIFLAWSRTGLRRLNPDALYALAALALVPYLALLGKRIPLYTPHNWIVLPVIGMLLVAGAQERGFVNRLLGHALPVWLGRISYCFYSFQLLVLLVLGTYHEAILRAAPALADNRVLLAAALLVLLSLSGIGFHTIEEPMRKAIRRRVRRPPLPAAEPADAHAR